MTIALLFFLVLLLFLTYYFRLYTLFFPEKRLVVLMYHHLMPTSENALTVATKDFENQLIYLKKKYTTIFFDELNASKKIKHKIILTFDDGYLNNQEFLLPLLKKHGMKATIFIPTAKIETDDDKMSYEQLRTLDRHCIELGLHSDSHQNYAQMSWQEAALDLAQNIQKMEEHQVPFTKVLAYPFGKFPKNNPAFFEMLKKHGIKYALRIGNRVQLFPFKKPYEVCRINVEGGDSLQRFKMKLLLGKLS